ncbi:hypothetical protein EYF80_011154 [Liparis tanakae]|uniref:Uncharacterized protein n=1 Tax=Liparis tanakae TaxID=230148 RepID=A0A4Z2IKM1_9TELE|nr:hypothetical protein EYF80_011154 [Liparis tanakae]
MAGWQKLQELMIRKYAVWMGLYVKAGHAAQERAATHRKNALVLDCLIDILNVFQDFIFYTSQNEDGTLLGLDALC